MTENERKARKVIDTALELNTSLEYARSLLAEKLNLDASNTTWPCLTDQECRNISANYPFPWERIRQVFPQV